MKKNNFINDKLIIIDDDTVYRPKLFDELINKKRSHNITTGSGFNFDDNRNYLIVTGICEMVEGYAGICFDFNQVNDFIFWYSKFYKHFSFEDNEIISKYLSASFLGDDFIISYCYNKKYAINNGRSLIKPVSYGFQSDALHQNNIFGSNMGSYNFLHNNIKILETFQNKYELNKDINELNIK